METLFYVCLYVLQQIPLKTDCAPVSLQIPVFRGSAGPLVGVSTPFSDLRAVVAVMNEEVLLEPQRPLPTCAVNQRHRSRNFLILVLTVCMIQKGHGAVESNFYLIFTEKRATER